MSVEMAQPTPIKDFTKLIVWQKAMDLTVALYEVTKKFPKEELYSSVNQMRRSSSSCHANLSEGNAVSYFKKKEISFYVTALGSIQETRSWLIQSNRLGFISNDEFRKLEGDCVEIVKMIFALIKRTKQEDH